jgi:hypothetical protein
VSGLATPRLLCRTRQRTCRTWRATRETGSSSRGIRTALPAALLVFWQHSAFNQSIGRCCSLFCDTPSALRRDRFLWLWQHMQHTTLECMFLTNLHRTFVLQHHI